MSSIAVFLVLGGATALAAGLAKNSVGSKQLKKNAVTAAKIKANAVTTTKIKKDAVTGTQVNEATLGTVPSADKANSANSANSAGTANVANGLAPLEATHIVGAPGEPAFESGSSNIEIPPGFPYGVNPVGFYKDHEGIVHLQGIAHVGTGGTVSSIFTLPPGFRPAPTKIVELEMFQEAGVLILGSNIVIEGNDLSGKVIGIPEGTSESTVLDGITFRAES